MRTLWLLSANVFLLAAIGFTHAKKWSTNKDSIIIEADNDDGILSDETIEKIECRTIDSEIGQCVTVRRCHPILFTDDGAIRNKELAETFATTDASCVQEISPKTSALDIGDRTICCAVSKLLSSLRTGLDEELDLYPTTTEAILSDEPQAEELSSVTTVDSVILEDDAIVLEDEPVQTTAAPSSIILSHLISNINPTAESIAAADEPVQTTTAPVASNQILNDHISPANDAVVIENLVANSVDHENILEDGPAEAPAESTTVREDIVQDEPAATTQATILSAKVPAQEIPVQDESESPTNEFDAPAPTTVRQELQDEIATTSAPVVLKEIEEIPGADEAEIPVVQTTTVEPIILSQTEIPAAVSDEAQAQTVLLSESGIPSAIDIGELSSESHPTTEAPQQDVPASETTVAPVPEVEIPVESQTGIYPLPSTSAEPETTSRPVESEGSLSESPSSDSSGEPEIIPSLPEASSSVIPETTSRPASSSAIPETTSQPASSSVIPETTREPSSSAIPETTQEPASSSAIPETTSVPASSSAIPETTSQPASSSVIPETTSQPASSSVKPETTSQPAAIVTEDSESSSQHQSDVSPVSDSSAEPDVISPLPEIPSSSSAAPEVSSASSVPSEAKPEVSSQPPPPAVDESESNPVPDRPFEGCPNVATYNQWPVLHNYPFLASILTRSKTGPLCSGSLIDSRHVLTAAHCLHRFNSRDVAGMQVRLGFSKYVGNDTLEHHYIERRASKVILHKHFHAQNKMDNNIALVQLNKPVVFDEHVNPINIFREVPGYDEGNCTASQAGFIRFGNRIVTEIGDGFINFIEAPMGDFFLRESLSRVYTENECKTDLNSQVTDKMVCAKSEVFEAEGITGIFKGNDGGPLLIKDGNQILQIGIKSWAYEGNQYPTVYTKVDSYFKWIADNLKM